MPIEQDDPCLRAKQLKAIRDKIATGQAVQETDLGGGNGTQQRVKFGPANLATLNSLISEADAACAIKLGNRRPRRFAIMPR